jgi:hypothetical protein
MIGIRRNVPESGKTLTVVFGLAALLLVMWMVSQSIASEAFRGVILLGAVMVALAVAGKTLSNWRLGVYLFLIWLLFEDFVRKYMGNDMYIYFAKDALIAIIYIALLLDSSRQETDRFRPPFKYALGLFFILGAAQFFNPGSPSLWYGVLGLKLYFYYIPLMFVGYGFIREERDLRRFLVINMGLAAVISVVGILQTIVGQDFLNPKSGRDIDELGHLVRVTPSGLLVARPPSVFVSAGRFSDYLLLAFILGLGTAGYLLLRTKSGRKIVFPAVALLGVATMVSGGRGAFVYAIASALVLPVGMLWGAPQKLGEGYRLLKAIRRSLVYVALALSLAVIIFPDVIGARWAFYRETISPDSPDSEATFRAWDYPVGEFRKAFSDRDWMIGHGIGTASLGGQYVSRIMEAPRAGWGTESGYGNLILEFGILGPILWLVWTTSLMFAAGRAVLRLKGTWAFPIAFAISWFAFLLLFPLTSGSLVSYQDFALNAYFWLLIGVLFRLPTLVSQESAGHLNTHRRGLVLSGQATLNGAFRRQVGGAMSAALSKIR